MGIRLHNIFSPRNSDAPSRDREMEVNGETVPVRVVEHPRSKRITLRLMPGGSGLKVTMPAHVSDRELNSFLERNQNWVAARRARMPEPVRLGEGALIPYQGQDHRILHLDRLRGLVEARIVSGEPSLLVPGDPAHLQRKLVDFFKRQARIALSEAVARHSKSLAVRPGQIRITDSTSRWGSCSSTRTLSFSWRIVLAPPEVLDYLAAHEVAHLREMNHSPRFWSLVRDICPAMEKHKAWLRTNGNGLHAVRID